MGRMRRPRRDAAWNPPKGGSDVTPLFAVLVAVPLLLPVVARFSFVLFALPMVATALAVPRCFAAASQRRARSGWRALGCATALASVASALAVASALGPHLAKPAFYVGAAASVLLLAGVLILARSALRGASLERVVDALLFDAVVVSIGIWFVALPGFAHHDVVLTLVFVVDLAALALASVGTLAVSLRGKRRTGWSIVVACGGACVGDAFAAVGAGGSSPAVTAACWTVAGIGLYSAARAYRPRDLEESDGGRWIRVRVALPLCAVLAFPLVAVGLWADGRLSTSAALYFGAFLVVTLLLAFGRQAHLLTENERAVARERRLRGEVVRRNEELEALTALATTMAETLEEDPVIERGLAALRIAARATSMALHVHDGDDLALRATVGDWGAESIWVMRSARSQWREGSELHGGRQIVRIAMSARGSDIGLLTLVRREDDPVSDEDLQLLKLLTSQVAIAIQNARDYCDRLEQAIRDPLTGLYNRRFFYEALDKEVKRSERYGSTASLVLFDVDDFKGVNDTFGHIAGDHVLCEIGRIAGEVIRPADSFARVGGEEFALLLPESSQLEALLVAERLRRAVAEAPILAERALTVSAGISSCPDDATSVEELESKADGALYWAKRNGKNLCAVATEVVVDDAAEGEQGMLAHLHALVCAIDAEHLKTRDHSENVAAYAAAIGERLGLAPERLARVRRAALLHDIGKIAVRASILEKPAKLTAEEFDEMKLHPIVGAEMLRHSGFQTEAGWVRAHHERIDGHGYPDGMPGRDIPLEARIIFVADSFEAMTSDRPYRAGMPVADAVEELRRCAGTQFDERVVGALCELLVRDNLPVLALREAGVAQS